MYKLQLPSGTVPSLIIAYAVYEVTADNGSRLVTEPFYRKPDAEMYALDKSVRDNYKTDNVVMPVIVDASTVRSGGRDYDFGGGGSCTKVVNPNDPALALAASKKLSEIAIPEKDMTKKYPSIVTISNKETSSNGKM